MNAIRSLVAWGFDDSHPSGDGTHVTVACSQCEALVLNGVALHELGCPNRVHECHSCNTLIPVNRKYCWECLG